MYEQPTPPEPSVPGLREAWLHAARSLALVWSTERALALLILVLVIGVALLPPAALYVSKLVVDGVVLAMESQAVADRNMALFWIGVEGLLLALLLAARRILLFQKKRLHTTLGFTVTKRILQKTEKLCLAQMEDPEIQRQLTMARQFATSRPYSLVNRLFEVGQHGLTLLSMAMLVWFFSPWVLALLLCGGIPLFVANFRFSGQAFRFHASNTPHRRERNYLEGLVGNDDAARERLHYGWGPTVLKRYSRLFLTLYREDRQMQSRHLVIGTILGLFSSIVFIAGKVWIVWVTILGQLTLGQMTMLVGATKQGQNSVNLLLSSGNGIADDLLYVSTLFALLELPEDYWTGTELAGPHPGDGLRFENVSFRYPGRGAPAMAQVSFHVPRGKHLGLVGSNGSGKTTLVKLAAGLYRPDSGRILFDGLDLREWQHEALARRLGVMFQPFVSFKLTARDNIAAGDALADLSDEAAMAAAARGVASELVNELPQGLDQPLGKLLPGGIELSGGQWQRLAMARTMLNENADLLILDEPTAALDPAAEAEFLARDHGDRSVLLISHRLANVRQADQIILLERGRVAEHGTHDALIALGGEYARLFAQQAQPYRAD